MIEAKVDERGRVLLPKNVRKELDIRPKSTVVLVKELMGYVIIPKKRFKHPTKVLENLISGSGHPNPKQEAREWILKDIEKEMK